MRRRRSSPDPPARRVPPRSAAVVAIAVLAASAVAPGAALGLEPPSIAVPSPWTALAPESGERVPVLLGGRLDHVVFLATWCPVCRDELPRLADLASRWQDDGYTVTLVIIANRYDRAEAIAFERRARPVGRVLVDTDDTVRSAFAVEEIPTHVLLDRDGVEIARGPTLTEGIATTVESEMRRER